MSTSFDAALDRQVWEMLHGRLAHLAVSHDDLAVRMDRQYGPFAAARDRSEEALSSLARLIEGPDDEIWLVEPDACPAPPGARVLRTAPLLQMIADGEPAAPPPDDPEILQLDEDDAADQIELALATEPGPWGALTHRYTNCIGIRRDGRLAAMAGQRMLPADGIAEVSGVCTWPEFQGQGLATRLIRCVMARMRDRGDIPYLHSYSKNAGAIGLYTSLGFRPRREMMVTVLVLN